MSAPTQPQVRAGQVWSDCERGRVRVIAVADGYAMLKRRRRNPFLASVDQMQRGEYGWELVEDTPPSSADAVAPAAEPLRYFAYDSDNGDYNEYDTLPEAVSSAQEALDYAGDDGWPDGGPTIAYGAVLGEAREVEGSRRPAGPADPPDFDFIVEYELTPPPSAFTSQPEARAVLDGVALIETERRRQVEAEGWTPEHDDEHGDGAMAHAAACYAYGAPFVAGVTVWPWSADWWKPTDRIRDLTKAGALIAAEIDRLQRAALTEARNVR